MSLEQYYYRSSTVEVLDNNDILEILKLKTLETIEYSEKMCPEDYNEMINLCAIILLPTKASVYEMKCEQAGFRCKAKNISQTVATTLPQYLHNASSK